MGRLNRHMLTAVLVAAVGLAVLIPLPSKAEAPARAPELRVDIAVIGGTPEGVAAAVAAARTGRRVLLVEPHGSLGGMLVHAGLNMLDMSRAPDGRPLNGGIFAQWYARLEGEAFDPATAAAAFAELVAREKNITLWLNTAVGLPERDGRRVTAVTVVGPAGPRRVVAGRYIDATEDADLAARAGVAFTLGRADYGGGAGQAATLIFRLRGVDWQRVAAYLADDHEPYTGTTARSLWGYGDIMSRYQPADRRIGVRGLNGGRLNDGSVAINGLWVFGVDPLSPASRAEATAVARRELPRLVAYMRAHCPGFARAELAGTAAELYIRESRHMAEALYTLTLDDVLENRDQPDAIGYGSYPVDVQAGAPGEAVLIAGAPVQYAVPLRSLIPASLDNLAVASRSAGYTSLAHGSARTVPVGMAAGQGAGVAAALSLAAGVTLPQLARAPERVAAVQQALRAQGVRLAPFQHASPLDGSPYAADVRHFRRLGLVGGGYANAYDLEEPVTATDVGRFLERAPAAYRRMLAPVRTGAGAMTVADGVALIYAAKGAAPADPVAAARAAGALEAGARPDAAFTRGMLYRAARVLIFPGTPPGAGVR